MLQVVPKFQIRHRHPCLIQVYGPSFLKNFHEDLNTCFRSAISPKRKVVYVPPPEVPTKKKNELPKAQMIPFGEMSFVHPIYSQCVQGFLFVIFKVPLKIL